MKVYYLEKLKFVLITFLKKNFFHFKTRSLFNFDPYFLDIRDFKINKINDTFNIKTHDLIKKLTKVNWS